MSVDQTPVRESNVEQTDEATLHYFVTDERNEWPIHLLVVEALEAVADRSTNEIEPLHHRIDIEALDRLFRPRPNGHSRAAGR